VRVVGGSLRGRRLETPTGRAIRPTGDRTREAVFNILAHAGWGPDDGSVLDGARVLDGFCGTGALGIEALSRGASHACFLDTGREALDLVRRNLANLGLADRANVLRADMVRPPAARRPCTLGFLDPPYGKDLVPAALTALAARGWFAPGAVVVAELGLADAFAPPAGTQVLDERIYGDTRMMFLRLG
jgi:16S rRNA (guanine966-N2)-methyltransferase